MVLTFSNSQFVSLTFDDKLSVIAFPKITLKFPKSRKAKKKQN